MTRTRCAVLGDPIAHSLSPVLHRAGYAAAGLDGWTYDAVRVPSGALADHLDTLDGSWRGLSLTMPLKREVLALATARGYTVSERARRAGGANTVVLDDEGATLDNTDLPGAAAAVRERYDGEVDTVAVLGAGATAASVGLALCDLGATRVRLHARDAVRAAPTAAIVADHPGQPQVDVVPLDAADPVTGDVVVSTVPAAAQDDALVARCAGVPVVFDVVYHPWPTPLATAALASDRVLVGGLDLLVHQAALQLEQFTGRPAPLEAMRDAGLAALTDREGAS